MTRGTTAIFRNDQWQVTAHGMISRLCCAPCRLQIDAELLLATETCGQRLLYGWPPYIVEKPWVAPELFFEAFEAAIAAHQGRYTGEVDPGRLYASFEEARRIAARRPARFLRPLPSSSPISLGAGVGAMLSCYQRRTSRSRTCRPSATLPAADRRPH